MLDYKVLDHLRMLERNRANFDPYSPSLNTFQAARAWLLNNNPAGFVYLFIEEDASIRIDYEDGSVNIKEWKLTYNDNEEM